MLRFLSIHRRYCHGTLDRFHEKISPLRSYFIPIFSLLRLATPTCSPKLVTSHHTGDCQIETRYHVRDESDDDTLSVFWLRQSNHSPSDFLRGLSESICRHPPVRIHLAKIELEGKRATSRKTPSSGISRMIKKRNETHYMHREKALETLQSRRLYF